MRAPLKTALGSWAPSLNIIIIIAILLKPPARPFGIVSCTFSDNLSQNICIKRWNVTKHGPPDTKNWPPFRPFKVLKICLDLWGSPWTGSTKRSIDLVHMGGPWTEVACFVYVLHVVIFFFFYLRQILFFFCFKFLSIHCHTQKQKKNKNYLR